MAFEAFSVVGKITMTGADVVAGQLDKVSSKISDVGKNITGIGKKLTAGLTLPIIGAGATSLKMAADFDDAMRSVNVMLRAGEKEFEEYKNQVLNVSRETGKSATDVANAFYQIVSAGYRGNDAIDILRVAMKGAVGGMADTVATTAALTKAMNIFNFEGVQGASRAMDIFFAVVDTGLLTFEEMAIAFPRAATSAAGLGVSIEETGAALGTLTKVSGSTEQAATALNAIFTQLINPSDKLQELYQKWGVENGPEAIKAFGGLRGVLEKVREETGGSADKMAELFPNVEALRGVLPLITTNAEDFEEAIRTVSESTGRTNEAFEEMSSGPGFKMRQAITNIKNAMIELGDSIAEKISPYMDKFIDWVQKIVEWFGKLDPRWKTIILGIAGALALIGPAIIGIGVALQVAGALASASPITWIILAIIAVLVALGVQIYILIKYWDQIKAKTLEVWGKIKDFFVEVWNKIKDAFQTAWEWIKNTFFNYTPLGILISNWGQIKQFFIDLWNGIKETFSQAWENIKNGVVQAWENIKQAFITAGQAIWDWMLNWVPGLNLLVTHWDEICAFFSRKWDEMVGWFRDKGEAVRFWFQDKFQKMHDFVKPLWDSVTNFLSERWENIKTKFNQGCDTVSNKVTSTWDNIKVKTEAVWNPIKDFFISKWNEMVNFLSPVIETMKTIIVTGFNWLKDSYIIPVWNSIKDFFKGLWEDIKENLRAFKDAFIQIWNSIKEGLKGPINSIIGFFNKLIDGVENAINSIVKGLNKIHIKVPDWVGEIIPGLKGKEWKVNLETVNFGNIPYLQKGGIIEKSGLAVVGEAGPELVYLPRGAMVEPVGREITVVNNFYSPKPLSESEIRRQWDIASRKLAMELGL